MVSSRAGRAHGYHHYPTAVAGRVPVVGRVPSGPLGGRTGTAGPADCALWFNVPFIVPYVVIYSRNEPGSLSLTRYG